MRFVQAPSDAYNTAQSLSPQALPSPKRLQLRIVLDDLPIHRVPPILQILLLPSKPIIAQPDMLPRINSQHHLYIRSAWRDLRSLTAQSAKTARPQRGITILLLLPVMRARQRRSGDIRRQDSELGVGPCEALCAPLYKPDEAGAEHGVCGCDHSGAQVLERVFVAEGFGEDGDELG